MNLISKNLSETFTPVAAALFFLLAVCVMSATAAAKTWTGVSGTDWHDGTNWSPAGIPEMGDDVTIPSGALANEPTISQMDVTIRSLNVNAGRTLTVNGRTLEIKTDSATVNFQSFGTIAGNGFLQTNSSGGHSINFDNRGLLALPLNIVAGRTLVFDNADGVMDFTTAITVSVGATMAFHNGHTLIAGANITNNGTISENGSIRFRGTTLTNNGTISNNALVFDRHGAQTLAGNGALASAQFYVGDGGNNSVTTVTGTPIYSLTDRIEIRTSNTLALNNAATFSNFHLTNNGTLSISSLTFEQTNGTRAFFNGSSATITGSGTLTMQSSNGQSVNFDNRGAVVVPLIVASGRTLLYDDNDGAINLTNPITIASSARIAFHNGHVLIANADVNNNGAIAENGSMRFRASTLINNGIISINDLTFDRNGAQTLAGNGTLNNSRLFIGEAASASQTTVTGTPTFALTNTLEIRGGNSLTLNNAATFSNFQLTNNGILSINSLIFEQTNASRSLFNGSSAAITGSGSLTMQSSNGHSINFDNRGSLALPLNVASGRTLVYDDNDGAMNFTTAITVASGATMAFHNSHTLFAGAHITNNGTISENGSIRFRGTTLTNNGTISNNALVFDRHGAQTLAGNGTFSVTQIYIGEGANNSTTTVTGMPALNLSLLEIRNNSQLRLNNALTFSNFGVNNLGTLSINSLTFGQTNATRSFFNGSSATINGSGTLTMQTSNGHSVNFDNRGTLSLPFVIAAGRTLVYDDGDGAINFTNTITVASGATLDFYNGHVLIANADITNNGTISGNGTLRFNGSTFTNNGAISNNEIQFSGSATQTINGASTFTSNFTVNNTAGVSLAADTTISATLFLTNGIISTGTNVLTIAASGAINRTNGYVIGALKKISVPSSFTFPVGTPSGYTPLELQNVSGGGDLTVRAVATNYPSLQAARALKEYWTLTKDGTLAADLTFNYLQTDVAPADESLFEVLRINGGTTRFAHDGVNVIIDRTANTARINNVSQFSHWTLAEPLAPTSSVARIGGTVIKANGEPLVGATLTLIDTATNQTRTVQSQSEGEYEFAAIQTGRTVIVSVSRAGYTFAQSQIVFTHNDDRLDINFMANESQTRRVQFDFDGDGKADIAVFRPSNGTWFILDSSTNALRAIQWGTAGDRIAPADYDGDGKTDICVFRQSNSTWYVRESSSGTLRTFVWGIASDWLVPADYDGDGKADFAVWRGSDGLWHIKQSLNDEYRALQFGQAGDLPSMADFDGDGKTDLAVYRAGVWHIRQSSSGVIKAERFGLPDDKPVAADYDGDGRADIAVFRPSNQSWYVLRSSNGGLQTSQFGRSDDNLTPGDYDGDGRADVSVWRAANGVWYLQQSAAGFTAAQFGAPNDIPVQTAFTP